jgi:hypothetical protein
MFGKKLMRYLSFLFLSLVIGCKTGPVPSESPMALTGSPMMGEKKHKKKNNKKQKNKQEKST